MRKNLNAKNQNEFLRSDMTIAYQESLNFRIHLDGVLESDYLPLMMIIVLLCMIAIGVNIVAPASAQFNAYNHILKESTPKTLKSERAKLAEKLAAFYWPLIVAIFLGWSFWTMRWDITWIIWPVAAVSFVALIGLVELFDKSEE